MLLNDPD